MDVPAAGLVKLCTVLYKFIERGQFFRHGCARSWLSQTVYSSL